MLKTLPTRFLLGKAMPFRAAVSLMLCGVSLCALQAQAMSFKFSGAGYHPQGSKEAILEDVPEDQNVEVVLYDPAKRNPKLRLLVGTTVYKVDKVRAFSNKNQQGPATKNLLLDFSEFQVPGTYELRVEGTDVKSQPLQISEYLYWDAAKPLIKSFYFQRCGQEVEGRTQDVYHPACHLKDADMQDENAVSGLGTDDGTDVVGGWHNGSDYAKYATSTALSAARLMALYEWNPKPFKYFRLDYPLFEPGYGTMDDLHHEVQAGLDWLLAMQRRDGAVYRKVAGLQWPGKVAPESDEQPRYIYGFSTQDTANTAAVFAMAARSYKKADLGYSIKTLMAAEKSWAFLEAHPAMKVMRSDSDFSGSGEFIDPNATTDLPYRLWAAAELYISTGKEKYHQYFLAHLKEAPVVDFSWQNPVVQGLVDYALYAPNRDPQAMAYITGKVTALANEVAAGLDNTLWGSGLRQYTKGSNLMVVERANLLVDAYRLSGNAKYRDLASRSVSYLLGVNPVGLAYVTGMPGHSVSHPAHRWMEVTGKVIPGYLVDGPNDFPTDDKTPKSQGPMSYVDDPNAKSVNEATLLNNSGLAFLLIALNDAYNTVKETETQVNDPLAPLHLRPVPAGPPTKGKKKPVKK